MSDGYSGLGKESGRASLDTPPCRAKARVEDGALGFVAEMKLPGPKVRTRGTRIVRLPLWILRMRDFPIE